MNMNKCPLDPRLASAASFVRDGAVLADIGTDHAYLPISLLLDGRIKFAAATDINRGPLDRARQNAARYGVSSEMEFILSDGLKSVPCDDLGITDIVICGMGGELIASIIDASGYVKNPDVHLILQPMSRPDVLRKYLAESGFRISDERLSRSSGKYYTCISTAFDGVSRSFPEAEYLIGECNIRNREPLFESFAGEFVRKLEIRIDGLESSGHDASEEIKIKNEILSIIGY